MKTKSNETILRTSDIEKIKGNYLAERLLRKWTEDFSDEDTGEVITVERNEVIMEKGTLMDSGKLSELNFFLQSGDIKDVAVSDQQRGCSMVKSTPSVWVANIKLNGKKKNIYLYADSLELAMEISIDYIEQKYFGNFRFLSVKELDYSNLISLEINGDGDMTETDLEDTDYYKMEVEITYEHEAPTEQMFIINGSNAEECKQLISEYIVTKNNKEGESKSFNIIIISAKTIPCNDIIDYKFSRAYFDKAE